MRKLAWFIIIIFALVLSIAIACAVNDPFKVAVSSMLNGVGGGILASLGGTIQNLANIVSTNVTYFTIYTFSMFIVGGLLWFGVKKLWAKRPAILQKPSSIQSNYQYGQTAAPPQAIQPAPAVEEKKEEATAK